MKERDQFRSFIEEHHEAFNDAEVPGYSWSSIEKRLDVTKHSKTIRLYRLFSVAAVGLLLLSVGTIIGMRLNNGVVSSEMAEYHEQEKFYTTQVNEKLNDLKNYESDPGVESDLKQLDEIYEELKIELADGENPNKQVIIDAMIINYQTKVAILERVLERMKESKQLTEEIENDEM